MSADSGGVASAAGRASRGAGDVPEVLERLPDIDYAQHPVFGRGRTRPTPWALLVGYARYLRILAYVILQALLERLGRRTWVESGATPHLDALLRDGIVPLRMRPDERAEVERAAQPYLDRLEAHRRGIERGRRHYGDGQIDTTRASAPELHATVERLLTETGILASVRAYVGSRAEVRKVTVQMNDEWDDYWRAPFEARRIPLPETAFFHVDNTYGVVKVILYLSEVTPTSGPFSYVPGTHRISLGAVEGLLLRVTDIWLDDWPEHAALLLSLPRRLRRRAKFGDDIPADAPWGRWLLDHEKFVTSSDGDMLLFDVMGIHRGGMIRKGERRILQIMMR